MRVNTITLLLAFVSVIAVCYGQNTIKANVVATISENGTVAHTITLDANAVGPAIGDSGVYSGSVVATIDSQASQTIQAQVTVSSTSINYYSNDANQLTVLTQAKDVLNSDSNLAPLVSAAENLAIVQSVVSQLGFPVNITLSIAEIEQAASQLNLSVDAQVGVITIQTPTYNGVSANIKITYSVTAGTTNSPGGNISGDNNARSDASELKMGATVAVLAGAALFML